jgi:hypothetical protein
MAIVQTISSLVFTVICSASFKHLLEVDTSSLNFNLPFSEKKKRKIEVNNEFEPQHTMYGCHWGEFPLLGQIF